jgi:hypothetical protein
VLAWPTAAQGGIALLNSKGLTAGGGLRGGCRLQLLRYSDPLIPVRVYSSRVEAVRLVGVAPACSWSLGFTAAASALSQAAGQWLCVHDLDTSCARAADQPLCSREGREILHRDA